MRRLVLGGVVVMLFAIYFAGRTALDCLHQTNTPALLHNKINNICPTRQQPPDLPSTLPQVAQAKPRGLLSEALRLYFISMRIQ